MEFFKAKSDRQITAQTGNTWKHGHGITWRLFSKYISEMNGWLSILSLKSPDMKLFLVLLLAELFFGGFCLIGWSGEPRPLAGLVRFGVCSPKVSSGMLCYTYYLRHVSQNHCSLQEIMWYKLKLMYTMLLGNFWKTLGKLDQLCYPKLNYYARKRKREKERD